MGIIKQTEAEKEDEARLFSELDALGNSNTKTTHIDNDSVFTYLFNTPTRTFQLKAVPPHWSLPDTHIEEDETVYIIPRTGDLLLSIEISGRLSSSAVHFFQYDESGARRIVYDTSTGVDGIENQITFRPFEHSGVPFLQAGKHFYVSVQNSHTCSLTATVAFLDTNARKELATYADPHDPHDRGLGVKIRHADNNLYQVFGRNDQGHSPNCLNLVRGD
jgi:hypothetical protein